MVIFEYDGHGIILNNVRSYKINEESLTITFKWATVPETLEIMSFRSKKEFEDAVWRLHCIDHAEWAEVIINPRDPNNTIN